MRNMLLFRNSLFLVSLLYSAAGFAQVTEAWVKRQNGNPTPEDFSRDLVVDAHCNAYVTGYSKGVGTGIDIAIVKYNSDGVKKWARRYNGPGNDSDGANAIADDHNGNVYVTGWSIGTGPDDDFVTIKYDENGDRKWVRRYNGPGNNTDIGD